MWAKWHMSDKSLPQFLLLQIKGHYKKIVWQNILYEGYNYMICIIINPLHTINFSLTIISNNLFLMNVKIHRSYVI